MEMRSCALVLLGLLGGVTVGCGEGSRGVALLPPPPERLQLSQYQPDKPFVGTAAGPAGRSTFTVAEDGYQIDVRDVLIAPGQKAVDVEMPGVAILQVREGGGIATIGGRERQLTMGAIFTVSEGEKARVEARGGPLILRAHVFATR
jgi:quercetin dioxygenase-like cupin family protein